VSEERGYREWGVEAGDVVLFKSSKSIRWEVTELREDDIVLRSMKSGRKMTLEWFLVWDRLLMSQTVEDRVARQLMRSS
jgi:hypothetical protein